MKKVLIGLAIAVAVAALIVSGVFAASWFWTGRAVPGFGWGGMMGGWRGNGIFGGWFNRNNNSNGPYGCDEIGGSSSYYGSMMDSDYGGNRGGGYGGMMGGYGGYGGYGGMMGGYGGYGADENHDSCPYENPGSSSTSGTRISLDQAQASLEDYLGNDPNLEIGEIMEFEYNFYGVILEKDTGRGAMELLVDPYNGSVRPEYGPNMMWNEKYGHMGSWYSTSGNGMTIDEAKGLAQKALDKDVPGAVVEGMGIEFYGYFTFDYAIDDEPAGMLSVNSNGDTWIHTWHGTFINEVEFEE